MKHKAWMVFFIFLFPIYSMGQEKLFYPEIDSVSIDYRSNNYRLDSIDASFIGDINLRPAAGFEQIYERNLAYNLFNNVGGITYLFTKPQIKPKFTGLPYVGFQYAFGSSVTQDLKLQYHQYFQEKTHLHFEYNRRVSNGFLRNSAYTLNDLNLLFYHQKKKYATNVSAYYGAYDYAQNFGIASDSALNDFSLEFIPVRNDLASSKVRRLELNWDNYFRIIGDSIVASGVKTRHSYSLTGREFLDEVIDFNLYDSLFIDTNGQTRDQYQTVHFANGAGVYFQSPYFQIDATVNHQYVRNQNLGANRDTVELFLHSNLWAAFGDNISLTNQFYFNFLGAIGEIKNYAKINYSIVEELKLKGNLNFENIYPSFYQRNHTANYYQWTIDKLKMQQKLQISGSLQYGTENYIQANVISTTINNGRYFIEEEWRQDTLDVVSLGMLQLKGSLTLGKFAFYPILSYRFSSENFNYQPQISGDLRVSYSTKLFKAQRLGMAVGADIGYETSYQYLLYNNVLDVLSPVQTMYKGGDYMRVNAFLALSMNQFRFFIKAVNLSSIWNDPKIRIDENYPIMPFIMRAGITWDFFN